VQHRPWQQSRFQATTLIAGVVLLLVLFVSVGYFFTIVDRTASQEHEKLLTEIRANEERWQSSRPASYRYVVDRNCICPSEYTEPYRVTVERGARTTEYLPMRGDDSTRTQSVPPAAVGLEELFVVAADAVTGSSPVDVVFDSRFGYVATLRLGGPNSLIGRPLTISVRDFDVLEYD